MRAVPGKSIQTLRHVPAPWSSGTCSLRVVAALHPRISPVRRSGSSTRQYTRNQSSSPSGKQREPLAFVRRLAPQFVKCADVELEARDRLAAARPPAEDFAVAGRHHRDRWQQDWMFLECDVVLVGDAAHPSHHVVGGVHVMPVAAPLAERHAQDAVGELKLMRGQRREPDPLQVFVELLRR